MIFSVGDGQIPESNKERNLYYKIFAGCIFNEIIEGNELGLKFIEKLKERYKWTCNEFLQNKDLETTKNLEQMEQLKSDFTKDKLWISFDYYIRRITENGDDGELADIFICGTDTFIAIEAKYLDNYDFNKDIKENRKRIKQAVDKTKKNGIEVLLVKEQKFKNAGKKGGTNEKIKEYLGYEHTQKIPFIIIFWEDILEILDKDPKMNKVSKYLSEKLKITL